MKSSITIPLDDETARRLEILSDACQASPQAVAASLIRDVLKDDEDAHFLLTAVPTSNLPN